MGNKDFGAAMPEVFEYSSHLLQSPSAEESQHYKITENQRKNADSSGPIAHPSEPRKDQPYLHHPRHAANQPTQPKLLLKTPRDLYKDCR